MAGAERVLTTKDDGELLPPGLALPDILSRRVGKPRLGAWRLERSRSVRLRLRGLYACSGVNVIDSSVMGINIPYLYKSRFFWS